MSLVVNVKTSVTPDAVAKLKEKDAKLKPAEQLYQKLPDEGIALSIDYDFGKNTEEAIKLFGDDICQSMIKGHIKFTLQGRVRSYALALLAKGTPKEEVEKQVRAKFFDPATGKNIWLPSLAGEKMSGTEKEYNRIKKISDPEAQKAEIAAIRANLAKLEAETMGK